MKEGWERKEQPASLSIRDLNEIISPAFPGKRIISAERIGIGLSNSNYIIHLEGNDQPYVIRFFRRGKEIAEKEMAIAQRIRQTIPVADFLYADTSFSRYHKAWAVLEWKDGVLLRDILRNGNLSDITSAASSVGSVLANIHSFSVSESGFFNKDFRITHSFNMDGERFLTFIEECLFQDLCGR